MQSDNLFKKSEDEYFVLRGKLEVGRITREQFEAELRDLMLEDTQGRHWMLGVDSSKWFVRDGQVWVEADPYSAGIVGKPVALPRPIAPRELERPVSVTPPPQMRRTGAVDEPKVKKRPGCVRIGCTAILAIILLLAAVSAALYFRIPQQLGLLPSAQRTFADTPDREAATALKDELTKAGIDTKGMGIYVLPFRDKPGSVAYVTLDSAQGFNFKSGTKDPVIDYFKQMAQSEATQKYGLQRIAIEYKGANGTSLLSLTASTDSIKAFVNGTLPRSEFLKKLDGQANWVGFYQEVLK